MGQKSQVRIVEKIVIKKRIWWVELLQTMAVLLAIIVVSWAVSHAEILNSTHDDEYPTFSASGTVIEISGNELSLFVKSGPENISGSNHVFDISHVTKIEDSHSRKEQISFSDISIGDKIIIRGFIKNEQVIIEKIIYMNVADFLKPRPAPALAASMIPTSTPVLVIDVKSEEVIMDEPFQEDILPDDTLDGITLTSATSTATSTAALVASSTDPMIASSTNSGSQALSDLAATSSVQTTNSDSVASSTDQVGGGNSGSSEQPADSSPASTTPSTPTNPATENGGQVEQLIVTGNIAPPATSPTENNSQSSDPASAE